MTPLPGPTGGYSTFDGGADFGIPKGAKNAAGALEFVNWVLQSAQRSASPLTGSHRCGLTCSRHLIRPSTRSMRSP